jgi:hypothetical protein
VIGALGAMALVAAQAWAQAPAGSEAVGAVEAPDLPIPGSAWRMSAPRSEPVAGASLHVYTSREDCFAGQVRPEELSRCTPWVDASRREIRLGVSVLDGASNVLPVAITPSRFGINLGGAGDQIVPVSPRDVQLIGHDPVGYGQLFVLLIDRSASMYADPPGDRRPNMEYVVQALLSSSAQAAFFPEAAGARTGVLLLTFSSGVRGVGGEPAGAVAILRDADSYAAAVDGLLDQPDPAGTHLFEAVEEVIGKTVYEPANAAFLRSTQGDPALVVLTDGFNNTPTARRCGENAAPLGATLDRLREMQGGEGARFEVYTVGFGAPYDPGFELAARPPERPSPRDLCGGAVDAEIDGGLERRGIDNVSLAYLAWWGGGRAHVGDDPRALGRFLGGTGTPMYRWYEVRATLGEAQQGRFRARLPLMLQVRSPKRVQAQVSLFPNPWLDLPPGVVPPDDGAAEGAPPVGSEPGTVWRATATLISGLGASLLAWTWVVGGYHLRRAVLRRGRKVAEVRASGSSGTSSGGGAS